MCVNSESVSNEIDESELQYEKHCEQRIWTRRGIVIDSRDDHENAPSSMRVNSESVSNEIDESELQYEKHSEQRIWTWRGIVIDSREDHENAWNSMRVNSESVSNEIDESKCILKYKVTKEFEHDEELWLSWENNSHEMLLIRCVSILNPFQMKSMKVKCNLKSILNKEFEDDEEFWYSIPCQNIESIACSMNPKRNLIWQRNANCLMQLRLISWKFLKKLNHQ
jgi:hypothetical protein